MAEVTVSGKHFHDAVSRALGAVERVKAQPLYSMLRLATVEGTLEVFATDGNAQIAIRIPATGSCAAALIDSTRLSAIAATVKDRGDVRIAFDGAEFVTAKVTAGRSRFQLDALKPETIGVLAVDRPVGTFTVAGKTLAAVMTALQPAISTEQTRYYLNGICLEPGTIVDPKANGAIVAVATDGLKLYARTLIVAGVDQAMPHIIVPRLTCSGAGKLFAGTDEVEIVFNDHTIRFAAGDTTYVSKLVEGTFPDWRRVSPLDRASSHSYDAKALRAAVDAAAVTADQGKTGRLLKLTLGDEETEFATQNLANPGVSGSDVCAHGVIGEPGTEVIGVNADFLREMIAALDAETVELGIGKAEAPILMRGAALNDRVVVLMPMRVA